MWVNFPTTHVPQPLLHLARRPADVQHRAALRREGDGTRSRGLISPSSDVLHGTRGGGGSCPSGANALHQSLLQLTPCAVSKTSNRHLEAVFPRCCAPQEDQSGSAADWRPPKSGEGNRPRDRAEWTMVLSCGHLRSAPVVVGVGLHTGWRPPALRASLSDSTRPAWAPLRWLLASPATRNRVCRAKAWLHAS